MMLVFFFSSRRRHTRYWRDWSSDVCSSDLEVGHGDDVLAFHPGYAARGGQQLPLLDQRGGAKVGADADRLQRGGRLQDGGLAGERLGREDELRLLDRGGPPLLQRRDYRVDVLGLVVVERLDDRQGVAAQNAGIQGDRKSVV